MRLKPDPQYCAPDLELVLGRKSRTTTGGLALNQIEDIIQRYTAGESVNRLATEYRVTNSSVRYYLVKTRVYIKNRKSPVQTKPVISEIRRSDRDRTTRSVYEKLLARAVAKEPKDYRPHLPQEHFVRLRSQR